MPVNRNALVRYKTIDNCLQNRFRKWTLDDLIDACSDALYEYEGIDKGVSKRTVQADIQMMRSDKLGYNAPIVVEERKYYTYDDAEYSITNIPLTDQDLGQLGEAISFLKQFRGFSHFQKLEGMVQKLEDHIYSKQENRPAIIDFEKNDLLKGIHYLEDIYQAILKKQSLVLSYQSFRAKEPQEFVFYAYLLKEYNNRWFVLGCREEKKEILNLALDRIVSLEISEEPYTQYEDFNATEYFKNVVGVTVNPKEKIQNVLLLVEHRNAPYMLTKPIHHSQKEVERNNEGVIVSLEVQLNYELEREIIGYGESVKVLKPAGLRNKIQRRLRYAVDAYDSDLVGNGLQVIRNKMEGRGYVNLEFLYSNRAFKMIKSVLDKCIADEGDKINDLNSWDLNPLLEENKVLKSLLFTTNLDKIVNTVDGSLSFKQARLIWQHSSNEKKQSSAASTDWGQQKQFYFGERTSEKKKDKEFSNWKKANKGFLASPKPSILANAFFIHLFLTNSNEKIGYWQFLPGSHRKIFGKKEVDLISQNTVLQKHEMQTGNALVFRPLVLRKFVKGKMHKNLQILELGFWE